MTAFAPGRLVSIGNGTIGLHVAPRATRFRPGIRHTYLHRGTTVLVLARRPDDWILVMAQGGDMGWTKTTFLIDLDRQVDPRSII